MVKTTLAFSLLLSITILAGCTNVRAAGPTPFPQISAEGGTIHLSPGVYTCPQGIVTSTHIIGDGAIVGKFLIPSCRIIADVICGPMNDRTLGLILSAVFLLIFSVCKRAKSKPWAKWPD